MRLAMMAALAMAGAGQGQAQIVRHAEAGPVPRPFLESAVLPAGVEQIVLSGRLADPMRPGTTPKGLEDFGDTETQATAILTRIAAILKQRGWAMRDVVRMNVYLVADPRQPGGRMDIDGFNRAFGRFFRSADNPNTVTRTAVQVVALAEPYRLVEVEVAAARVPPR